MNFNLQRHARLAGCVAIFIGFYLKNWTIVAFGNLVVLVGYMWTVAKVEFFIEKFEKKLEEPKED